MRHLARRLLLVWLVSALVLTLAPFTPRGAVGFRWAQPAYSFELLANVALFVPMGVLAVIGGLRRRGALAAGLLLTLAIEGAQMHLRLRHPSYLDLVANTAGAGLGAFFALPFWRIGLRLHARRASATALVAGVALSMAMVARYPHIPDYAYAFPFAIAVAGSLFASGVWSPATACFVTPPAVLAVAGRLWHPLDPGLVAAAVAGAVLGAWALVLRRTARLTRA